MDSLFNCKYCKTNLRTISHLKYHIATKKHIDNLSAYKGNISSQSENNITTDNTSSSIIITDETTDKLSKFKCVNCNKYLASLFSLNRHYKTCKNTNTMITLSQSKIIENMLYEQRLRKTEIKIDASQSIITTNTSQLQKPTKGIVYFIQPVELIGTGRYKIGHSSKTSLNRCLDGYNRGSRYINIQECFEPLKLETKLKLEFKNKFKLIGGTEYFAGDERQMKKIFADTCELHDSAYSIFYDSYAQPPETNNSISQDSMPSTEADVTGSLAAVPTSINDL